MKELFINRHAKSSWKDSSLRDFDRPLNGRGKKDAPEMARRLRNREDSVDYLLSSSARRAQDTAKEFADLFNLELHLEPGIYEAGPTRLISIINSIPNKYNSVVIFGHNPGFSYLVDYLTDYSLHIPTCGIVKIKFDFESWSLVSAGTGQFVYFDFPKNTSQI